MAIKYPKFSEEEIRENSQKLGKMDVVKHLTGNEFAKDGTPLNEIILKYFESLGNNIYSDLFGDVALTKSSIRSERRHGYTPPKIAAFAALPDVINNGVVIDSFEKHRGVDRIVVAAPIQIGKEKYYMGVMLQRDVNSQRLYMHDVVIEKEISSEVSGILNSTGPSLKSENLYITNIILNALNVNREISEESNTQNPNMRFMMYDSVEGSLTEQELEDEINNAGLLLTSKDNNKNNRRVRAWVNENHPEISGDDLLFENDNSTGKVKVKEIRPRGYLLNALEESVKKASDENAASRRREAFWNAHHTYAQIANLEEQIGKMLERKGIDATVHHSRSSVGSRSFYVETDSGVTIKVSDHNTIGQQMTYNDTAFIDLHEIESTQQLYDSILSAIERGEAERADISEDEDAPLPSFLNLKYMQYGTEETADEKKAREESVSNLKAENDILRARAEYWKAQTQQTKENTVRQQDTDRLANELLREYESKADKAEVKTSLKELGDWLVQNSAEDLSYDELYDRAEDIAEEIVDSNYTLLDDSNAESLEQLKDYLKSNRLNLSAADFRDTGDEDFRKKYGRYFRVSENGMGIDSAWLELGSMFGEGLFPTDTYAPGDMLNMIGDENGKNQKIKIYGLRFLSSTDRYARI